MESMEFEDESVSELSETEKLKTEISERECQLDIKQTEINRLKEIIRESQINDLTQKYNNLLYIANIIWGLNFPRYNDILRNIRKSLMECKNPDELFDMR